MKLFAFTTETHGNTNKKREQTKNGNSDDPQISRPDFVSPAKKAKQTKRSRTHTKQKRHKSMGNMPTADFTAASSSRRFGPQEVPHKQKHHKLGSSSVIVADVTNVGDPRLVIPVHMAHASFLVVKKGGQHDWPVVPCNASYALDGFPPVSSVVFLVSCWRWGSFFNWDHHDAE